MYEHLRSLLSHHLPRLVCIPASGYGTTEVQHTVSIEHEVSPPLDAGAVRGLRTQFGDLPHLLAFYERYGSARLFRDLKVRKGIGMASAYYIAPPDMWPELRSNLTDWFADLSEQETEELLPDWMSDYVVVGEIPNSGNYFLVPLAGENRGYVFEFEHDGFEFIERGKNFEVFVEYLASVESAHLRTIGGHTRYTDGSTEAQWMPVAYEHGGEGA